MEHVETLSPLALIAFTIGALLLSIFFAYVNAPKTKKLVTTPKK